MDNRKVLKAIIVIAVAVSWILLIAGSIKGVDDTLLILGLVINMVAVLGFLVLAKYKTTIKPEPK